MSRIGQAPIAVPTGVDVSINGDVVTVKGKLGELTQELSSGITASIEDNIITVQRPAETKEHKAKHGLYRALINNMILGVSVGWSHSLELVGVGYRAQAQGKKLNLTLGFSHPVSYDVPEGIQVETPSQTEILVKGIDKQKVGQVAAEIRRYRPPEPYKGKGVKYKDEFIFRKEGKKK